MRFSGVGVLLSEVVTCPRLCTSCD